jgi:cation diffusion facilitator CzcD-associated flavoprotein CzcO
VIGAGVSGLKAAADLQAAGAEVVVLEARDRWVGVSACWRWRWRLMYRPCNVWMGWG